MSVQRILREPLVHFFLIGAALFVTFAVVNAPTERPLEIVVTKERAAAIEARFERTWRRPPTESELEGLIDQWVQEELLYREGLALGLDRDDPVIRRRVAQKMGFVAEALSSDLPDDQELAAWLADNAENYREARRYTLRQVYFAPAGRGAPVDASILGARAALRDGADWRDLGDRTLLPGEVDDVSETRLGALFGSSFVDALDDAPARTWIGPVESGYGRHLVYVESRTEGRLPPLEEIRQRVEQDYLQAQASRAEREFVAALRDRYEIRVETNGSPVNGEAE